MVDVKKVTAIIRKPYVYLSQTSTVTEYINFNPANNPPSPGESISTVYTIDPFAVFQQEDNLLKVKIPFTRFYKIKYVINPIEVNKTNTSTNPFDISKTHLAMTERIALRRVTSGSPQFGDEIRSGVYKQDGSALLTFDPVSSIPPQYVIRTTLTSAIFEGIVELYAGDTLIFEHTRTMLKRSFPGFLNVDILGNYFDPSPLTYPVAIRGVLYPSVNPQESTFFENDFIATASFFFEISEITDL